MSLLGRSVRWRIFYYYRFLGRRGKNFITVSWVAGAEFLPLLGLRGQNFITVSGSHAVVLATVVFFLSFDSTNEGFIKKGVRRARDEAKNGI